MFSFLVFVLTAVCFLILQISVFPLLSISGVRPDLILLATVGYSLTAGRRKGLLFGFFLGLLQDVLSGGLFGTNGLIKGFVGYVVGVLRQQIADRSLFSPAFAIVLGSLLNGSLYFLIARALYADKYTWWFFIHTTLLETGYNLVVGLAVAAGIVWARQEHKGLASRILHKAIVLLSERT